MLKYQQNPSTSTQKNKEAQTRTLTQQYIHNLLFAFFSFFGEQYNMLNMTICSYHVTYAF